MNIFAAKHIQAPAGTQYATARDFCRIFENDMDRLYLLSFLLTGDHDLAEKCFVRGLEASKASNAVFKEWAESWARRMIITNAIRMIGPRLTELASSNEMAESDAIQPAEIAVIVELPAFDRFAYVLSVLEGYSLQQCALLLDCRPGEVNSARMRALQHTVNLMERRDVTKASHSSNHTMRENVPSDGFSELAATA